MAGGKPRARKEHVPAPKEHVLQITVAKLLDDHCLSDWEWTHIPSGEERPAEMVMRRGKMVRICRDGAKLKAMGLKKGWPDFIFITPFGSLMFLELKRAACSPLSDEQHEFHMRCVKRGNPYVVAWTIDQVLQTFEEWGCLRIKYGSGA
jgi:hypothetical protein